MARLAASPEIYHSCIKVCRIHEQVNQVSHELIQVAWIQGTSWALARRSCSISSCQAGLLFHYSVVFWVFFHHSHHILFVFLSGVSFSAPAEQLSSSRLVNINDDCWWEASRYLHVDGRRPASKAHNALLHWMLIALFALLHSVL